AHRSSRPVMGRSTSRTARLPAPVCRASTLPAPRRPGSTPTPGSPSGTSRPPTLESRSSPSPPAQRTRRPPFAIAAPTCAPPPQPDTPPGDAYRPLADAQLGRWTHKAVKAGLNTRQIDEVQVFNLAATRPDLLTGINPATGQPAPYGSVGVDINCAVIGFTDKAPTANLATPVPNSQFPPR